MRRERRRDRAQLRQRRPEQRALRPSAAACGFASAARIFSSDFAPEPGEPAQLLRLGRGAQRRRRS